MGAGHPPGRQTEISTAESTYVKGRPHDDYQPRGNQPCPCHGMKQTERFGDQESEHRPESCGFNERDAKTGVLLPKRQDQRAKCKHWEERQDKPHRWEPNVECPDQPPFWACDPESSRVHCNSSLLRGSHHFPLRIYGNAKSPRVAECTFPGEMLSSLLQLNP